MTSLRGKDRQEFLPAAKRDRSRNTFSTANRAASKRFWCRIKIAGAKECWIWDGRLNEQGYGLFDTENHPVLAHRFSYFLANPSHDRSLKVCHSCDTPRCCNPNHLWLGTQADNVDDMMQKGRHRTITRRGEDSNKAKITAADAIYIFNSSECGPVLGARFGISKEAVNHIKRGKNWAHVTGGRP